MWEPLREHLRRVSETGARFADLFGWSALAGLSGRLHDVGKCSADFQTYIAATDESRPMRGPDHSTAGAREAIRLYGPKLGKIVAFIVAGHHGGLNDADDLERRIAKDLPSYEGWQSVAETLPPAAALAPSLRPKPGPDPGFTQAFLVRFLYSCLVDADRLETAAFYTRAEGRVDRRAPETSLDILLARLTSFMTAKRLAAEADARTTTETRLAVLRAQVLDSAVEKASLPPGLFTLTVPTGGGKTLASLSFALEHAVAHDLRRIVYVIPFSSIVEQTAAVFRMALAASPDAPNIADVVEHHANFDGQATLNVGSDRETGRGTDVIERLQRATENWDAPVIVTTAVQFFESLFANRPSACRKLHNLAKSVIVLDEAQTLPLPILRPCLAALDELARNYGASIVVCTAAQPAWRKIDRKLVEKLADGRPGANFGLDIAVDRELAPDPQGLFEALKRVDVEHRREPIADDVVVARFAEQPQMLCIVNSRRHAKAVFDAIADMPGAIHLSTWMCPRHRRLVLEQACLDLKAERPVRIVSTSLIEAGVDIDLPEVWRAAAGLDSCLQAAGRCNREFRHTTGRLVIFSPLVDNAPHDLRQAWDAGRAVLRRHTDPQTLDAVKDYFGELYLNKGTAAFDASKLDRTIWPILPAISERADSLAFPFASIARAFKVIDDTMAPVIVPWRDGPDDLDAATLLNRIGAMDKPLRDDLRRLQQYMVSVPQRQRDAWLAAGVLRSVHPAWVRPCCGSTVSPCMTRAPAYASTSRSTARL